MQPPYSGYAPPHLAQPAYPMHLPHDPMVNDFLSSLSLFSFSRLYARHPRCLPRPNGRSITRDCARFFGLDTLGNFVIDTRERERETSPQKFLSLVEQLATTVVVGLKPSGLIFVFRKIDVVFLLRKKRRDKREKCIP